MGSLVDYPAIRTEDVTSACGGEEMSCVGQLSLTQSKLVTEKRTSAALLVPSKVWSPHSAELFHPSKAGRSLEGYIR